MTNADELKEIVTKLKSRQSAILCCRNHSYIYAEDFTDSDNNDTYIFYMKDDSELRIDTENYVYTDSDNELQKINAWED